MHSWISLEHRGHLADAFLLRVADDRPLSVGAMGGRFGVVEGELLPALPFHVVERHSDVPAGSLGGAENVRGVFVCFHVPTLGPKKRTL